MNVKLTAPMAKRTERRDPIV